VDFQLTFSFQVQQARELQAPRGSDTFVSAATMSSAQRISTDRKRRSYSGTDSNDASQFQPHSPQWTSIKNTMLHNTNLMDQLRHSNDEPPSAGHVRFAFSGALTPQSPVNTEAKPCRYCGKELPQDRPCPCIKERRKMMKEADNEMNEQRLNDALSRMKRFEKGSPEYQEAYGEALEIKESNELERGSPSFAVQKVKSSAE